MQQWLRKARVTFSGSKGLYTINPSPDVYQELRISFSVSRGISGSANTFEINLWNLSPDHRNRIGREFDDVTLEAGYIPPGESGNVGIISKGQVRDVEHKRVGPDIVTSVSCGDGDAAYRKATISKTIPSGTPIPDVVEQLYKELETQGIDKGEWVFPDDIRTLKRPYSMCGGCARELNLLGRSNGFYWSIQNQIMEIIPGNGSLPGMVQIDQSSGMIDTPTITDNGVKVKALLNPQIRPNRQIQIISETLELNGSDNIYRVSQVDFKGDNMNGNFIAIVHGESINENKVDEGVKP